MRCLPPRQGRVTFFPKLNEDANHSICTNLKLNWKVLDFVQCGGAEGIRTPDLINAIDALSQLSYSPTVKGWASLRNVKSSRRF